MSDSCERTFSICINSVDGIADDELMVIAGNGSDCCGGIVGESPPVRSSNGDGVEVVAVVGVVEEEDEDTANEVVLVLVVEEDDDEEVDVDSFNGGSFSMLSAEAMMRTSSSVMVSRLLRSWNEDGSVSNGLSCATRRVSVCCSEPIDGGKVASLLEATSSDERLTRCEIESGSAVRRLCERLRVWSAGKKAMSSGSSRKIGRAHV